ncbi:MULTISPECIES: hypothetical protein [Butyricimonas]|uniref:hypothetical protein n=1 Tax=Butyricimonas TaxID=574697 RepID=UPI0012FB51FE|nr:MULTISPECIES: hypothetical protein [Butyricimonas]
MKEDLLNQVDSVIRKLHETILETEKIRQQINNSGETTRDNKGFNKTSHIVTEKFLVKQ